MIMQNRRTSLRDKLSRLRILRGLSQNLECCRSDDLIESAKDLITGANTIQDLHLALRYYHQYKQTKDFQPNLALDRLEYDMPILEEAARTENASLLDSLKGNNYAIAYTIKGMNAVNNYEKEDYFIRATNLGNADACYMLGKLLLNSDPQEAADFFAYGTALGSIDSAYKYALHLEQTGDYTKAHDILTQLEDIQYDHPDFSDTLSRVSGKMTPEAATPPPTLFSRSPDSRVFSPTSPRADCAYRAIPRRVERSYQPVPLKF
jgi:hypothetical protein